MNEANIIKNWYQPIEINSLKKWLIYAIAFNCIIGLIEWIRGNNEGLVLTLIGVLCLTIGRIVLPNRIQNNRRLISLLSLFCGLIVSLILAYQRPATLFNIWSTGWLFIPSALAVYWLLNSRIRLWNDDNLTDEMLQLAMHKNVLIGPKHESFATHIFLLHAISFVVLPLLWIADVAISPGNALGGDMGNAFSLEHFSYVLSTKSFYIWSKNSLIVSIGTTLFGLSIAIPAGYAFSRYNFRGRKESMAIFMLIQMFPGAIILVPYFMVMKTLGILNTSIGLIIVYSVSALPICVWMLKGYFDTIPHELEEAAMLDGCSQFQIFYKIILPLSVTAISITALIAFLGAWNEFLLALVFNTSNEMYTLPVGLASMIPATGQRWGDFAAASILVSTPVVVLFILFQKSLIEGLSAGAVKG